MKQMHRPIRTGMSFGIWGTAGGFAVFSVLLMAATATFQQKDREWAWLLAALALFDSRCGYPGEGPRRPAFSPSVLSEAVALHNLGNLVPASRMLRQRAAPRWVGAASGVAPSEAAVMWYTIAGMHSCRRVPTPDDFRRLRRSVNDCARYPNRGSRSAAAGRASGQPVANRHRRDDDNATDVEDDEPDVVGDAGVVDDDDLREEGQQAWQRGAFQDPVATATRTAGTAGNDVHVQADQAVEHDQLDICPICDDQITSATVVVHTGCVHRSCLACSVKWAQRCNSEGREHNCPSCRAAIVSISRVVDAGWNVDSSHGRAPCMEMATQLVLARTFCGVCRRPSGPGVPVTQAALSIRQCAACWMCYHWDCISTEQRALWSTAPDICPRCNGHEAPASCPICRDAFTPTTVVVNTGCPHKFCLTCAIQWAQPGHRDFEQGQRGDHTCPLCRADIFSFMRDVGEGWTAEGYRGRPLCMEMTPGQAVSQAACSSCRRSSVARADTLLHGDTLLHDVPAMQHCAVCWRCYHWECLPSELRDDWLSDPYICPRCNGRHLADGRRAGTAVQSGRAGGPPVGWQGYAWPAVRLQAANEDTVWGPAVADLRMSFFYVPLFLCGLSRVAGAPPGGYLRAQDVLQWQQVVDEVYTRPGVQAVMRGLMPPPLALNLSFDRLVQGVATVIVHVYGHLGDAQAIHNVVVRASDGYVSPQRQESVMSPSDRAIMDELAQAGMPEMVAQALYNDGYRMAPFVPDAPMPTNADGHDQRASDDSDGGLSEVENIMGQVMAGDEGGRADPPPGERNESPIGIGVDMSDGEVEEQTDDDIWQQLESLTANEPTNQTMARELICRLRVRPRLVRRVGAVLSVSQQADVQRLTMMYELWTGDAPPSVHAERVTAFDRMLRQIRASTTRDSSVRSSARQPVRNVARSNRSLLSGAIPSVPVYDVGRLRTGDPQVDLTLPAANNHCQCSACDAILFPREVVRQRGRLYGRYCCRRGQVALRPLRWGRDAAADQLMTDMWLTHPSRLSSSSLCRRHGRMLNATFAMSCQAVRCRPMLTRGMQTFVVNTRIAHYMGALLPDDGHRPQFAQLYVHDAYTNAAVGSRQQFGHRDALQEYFARSRTGIGAQVQTALLTLVATIRDVIMRVCCIKDHMACMFH